MRLKFLLLSSLIFIGGMAATALGASYTDGIEYFKAGQPERAKIILERTFNDPATNKAEACYYLGEVYSKMNKNDSASYYYKMGLAADPTYVFNKIGEAKLLMKSNLKEAESMIKDALKEKMSKKNPAVYLAVAQAYYQNLIPEYQKYLDKALDYDKKFAETYMFEGDILVDRQQYGDAAGYYEMAINFDPNCVPAYVKYSNIYFPINAQSAIQKLETLLQLAPNSALAQREMAEAYYKNGQYGKAVDAYGLYMSNPNHFDSDQARYGALLFFDKKYEESLDLINKVLESDPDNFVAKRLAMYDNYELKRYADGVAAAEKFMSSPNNPQFNSRDYLTYGYLLIKNDQPDKAVSVFEKAIAIEPTNLDLYKELSDAYRSAGDYVKSADAYNEYMKLDSANVRVQDYFILGGAYYQAAATAADSTDVEKAEKTRLYLAADSLFKIVIERAPEDYRGHLWRARANAGLDPETTMGTAKPYYEAAMAILEKDNNNPRALVECYKYLGHYNYLKEHENNVKGFPQTRFYWEKVLTVDPEAADIKGALEQLPK